MTGLEIECSDSGEGTYIDVYTYVCIYSYAMGGRSHTCGLGEVMGRRLQARIKELRVPSYVRLSCFLLRLSMSVACVWLQFRPPPLLLYPWWALAVLLCEYFGWAGGGQSREPVRVRELVLRVSSSYGSFCYVYCYVLCTM